MAHLMTLPDAVAELVGDGDSVALEGFTHLIPFAAGHEILRQGRRELELIRMTPDLLYDQMIGMGVGAAPGLLLRRQSRRGVAASLPRRDRERLAAPDRDRRAQPRRHGQPLRRGRRRHALRDHARLRRDRPHGAHHGGASSTARSPASSWPPCRRSGPTWRSSTPRRPTARATCSCGASRACRRRRCSPRSARWSRSSGSSTSSSRARAAS